MLENELTGGRPTGWDLHKRAERLMFIRDRVVAEEDQTLAQCLYLAVGALEDRAFQLTPQSQPKMRAILGYSAVSAYFNGGDFDRARVLGESILADLTIVEPHSINVIRDVLGEIQKRSAESIVPSQEENLRLHDLRQQELIQHGILGLVFEFGDSDQIGGQGAHFDLRFRGEPIARVRAQRTKQGDGTFYGETIEVSYDGTVLSVEGTHLIYQGPIQRDDGVISESIKEAWDNAKRKVITDFDPRKSIY